MSGWNHRLVFVDGGIGVYEVYYDDSDAPFAYGDSLAYSEVDGDLPGTIEAVRMQLYQMIDGTVKPILTYPEDFTGVVDAD